MLAACKWRNLPLDTQMKQHYSFKKGSYWIYNDSVTGAVDSLVVLNRINFIDNIGVAREHREIEIDSVFTDGNPSSPAFVYHLEIKNVSIRAIDSAYYPWDMSFYYPPMDTICTSSALFNTATTQIGSYMVNGTTYENVTQFYRTDKDSTYYDLLYIAPGFGVIKLILGRPGDMHYWQLVRSNMVH
jgi:hypothetical protein